MNPVSKIDKENFDGTETQAQDLWIIIPVLSFPSYPAFWIVVVPQPSKGLDSSDGRVLMRYSRDLWFESRSSQSVLCHFHKKMRDLYSTTSQKGTPLQFRSRAGGYEFCPAESVHFFHPSTKRCSHKDTSSRPRGPLPCCKEQ